MVVVFEGCVGKEARTRRYSGVKEGGICGRREVLAVVAALDSHAESDSRGRRPGNGGPGNGGPGNGVCRYLASWIITALCQCSIYIVSTRVRCKKEKKYSRNIFTVPPSRGQYKGLQ